MLVSMKQVRLVAMLLMGAALVAGLLTLFLPQRPVVSYTPIGFTLSLVFVAMIMVWQTGASALFLWGLKGFKQELRVAYILICLGIVMFGLSYLQTPILTYLDQGDGFWVRSGIVAVPFVAPIVLFYVGVKRFARLFGLKDMWTSGWFAIVLSAAVTAGTAVLAFVAGPGDQQLIMTLVFIAWVSMILVIVDVMILKIRASAGPLYKRALGWFAAAMIVETLSGLIFVVLTLFGVQAEATKTGVLDVPEVIGAFAFVWAGYYFKLINEDVAARNSNDVSLIDVVIFTASQVSNPKQIDPLLDTLRSTTAQIRQQGGSITAEQEAELRRVYLGIEQYLVTAEPLRQLSVEQIRHKVSYNFGLDDQQLRVIVNPPQTVGVVSAA